jgi:putative ABC transport system ATP-binding protein
MSNEPICVHVCDVHKSFKRGSEVVDVLNGLNLDVRRGEFVGLMGPSGSGKTTLLNLIAGLDRPTQGEVKVQGQKISHMTEGQLASWRTRNIGFVFQFYHLLPVLTAFRNVELPLLLLPLSASQRRKQVTTALDIVGLSDRVNHRPGQLSGGRHRAGDRDRPGVDRRRRTDRGPRRQIGR